MDNELPPSNKAGVKHRANDKLSRIPIKVVQAEAISKPGWIRVRAPGGDRFNEIKQLLRANKLYTVCEEANCPNIGECFNRGTATFMIMGDICTRRCTFCDVGHGRPRPLDQHEPEQLANAVYKLQLKHVVITSVDRDDLRDGGAGHFAACMSAIRRLSAHTKIEILVPDFRGRMEKALAIFDDNYPDIFNHNIETVPRLYKAIRPGSEYRHSLNLLHNFKNAHPDIWTKSGIMVGLGEEEHELMAVMQDLRSSGTDAITIGQYLQPSAFHAPVIKYYTPEWFEAIKQIAYSIGFSHVASGPLVRSSYHADEIYTARD